MRRTEQQTTSNATECCASAGISTARASGRQRDGDTSLKIGPQNNPLIQRMVFQRKPIQEIRRHPGVTCRAMLISRAASLSTKTVLAKTTLITRAQAKKQIVLTVPPPSDSITSW